MSLFTDYSALFVDANVTVSLAWLNEFTMRRVKCRNLILFRCAAHARRRKGSVRDAQPPAAPTD
jgi:hypothetical protein